MTRLRPTLAAVFAALLLAAPTAAAGRPSHMTAVELARAQERAYMQQASPGRDMTAVELARAQERAYMQQANPVRDMTAVELALAQERAFMQQANARRMPPRTATATPGGPSTALVAGSIAAGLLAATGGLAAIAVRRRHVHRRATSLQGLMTSERSTP
jgi:hypothetical protein